MGSTKVNQLQILQQNLQHVLVQKQQMESQLTELDSALTELKITPKAYKIIGKMMVEQPKEKMLQELQQKKEISNLRLNSFVKQEENLKQNMEKIQQEAIVELKQQKK